MLHNFAQDDRTCATWRAGIFYAEFLYIFPTLAFPNGAFSVAVFFVALMLRKIYTSAETRDDTFRRRAAHVALKHDGGDVAADRA